jgi:hypothetical protein
MQTYKFAEVAKLAKIPVLQGRSAFDQRSKTEGRKGVISLALSDG